MEPPLPAETEVMEREVVKEERTRRIQFSVPSAMPPTQLDPRQVEMIRRRRPTPATLFRLTDPPSPEEDPQQWVLGEGESLAAKLVNMSVYQPPSLKAVQLMAQRHLKALGMSSCGSVEKEELSSEEEEEEEEQDEDEREESHRMPSRAVDVAGDSRPARARTGSKVKPKAPSSCHHGLLTRHHRGDEDETKERDGGKEEE